MIDQIAPADFARWLADMAKAHPLERAVLLDVREPHELQWASVDKDALGQNCQLVTIPMGVLPVRCAAVKALTPSCSSRLTAWACCGFRATRGADPGAGIRPPISAPATRAAGS